MVLRDRATTTPGTLNERFWVQQDANWNTSALVDGSGIVDERYTYDPYGVTTVYDGSYSVRGGGSSYVSMYLYQGERFDSVSGLDEASGRFYSSTLQTWMSLDPIRFEAGSVDLYEFESDNSVNNLDPTGLADRGYNYGILFSGLNLFFGGPSQPAPPQPAPSQPAPSQPAPPQPSPPKPPESIVTPGGIVNSFNRAWLDSFPTKPGGVVTSQEHGGYIYINPTTGDWSVRPAPPGTSGVINLNSPPAPGPGEGFHGTFHTHPYSPTEGGHDGISFSSGDIINFRKGKQGIVKYVKAGTCIFALHLTQPQPAGYDPAKLQKIYDDTRSATAGTVQVKIEAAVKASAAYAGMTYYKDCSNPNGKAASTCLPVK